MECLSVSSSGLEDYLHIRVESGLKKVDFDFGINDQKLVLLHALSLHEKNCLEYNISILTTPPDYIFCHLMKK